MEAWLSKALWRAGTKLGVGLVVVGAVAGIRIVTATPTGIEGDLAELDRLDAELAAGDPPGTPTAEASSASASANEPIAAMLEAATRPAPTAADADLDRMVRCRLGGSTQFMRAADCATRGGGLEELPPPEPDAAAPDSRP